METKKYLKVKRIFNMRLAIQLINKGCECIDTEEKKEKEGIYIFKFIDDDIFRKTLKELTQ